MCVDGPSIVVAGVLPEALGGKEAWQLQERRSRPCIRLRTHGFDAPAAPKLRR